MRLPTQYGSRELNLLYLVVDGNFTPLLGCDACLDLEVLEFMNVELITTPESKQPKQELKGVVSKETVGLRRWGSSIQKFRFYQRS